MKILITGDFCPNHRIKDFVLQKDSDTIFGDFLDVVNDVDYSIVNLECPILPENSSVIEKVGPTLSTSTKALSVLKEAGFNLLTLANNHIKDVGEEGVQFTIKEILKYELSYVGAGKGVTEARKINYFILENMRIAVINVGENEFSTTNSDSEYGAYGLDIIDCTYLIQEAKSKADKVLLIYHGGHEDYSLPSPRMKKLFYYFVDRGVDCVICHHAHCYSGYEVYKECPIFYGLGNFSFDWEGIYDRPWNYGYAVILEIDSLGKLKFEILPYSQGTESFAGVRLLKEKDKEVFFKNINELNEIIRNDSLLREKFNEFIVSREKQFEIYLQPYNNRFLRGLYSRGLLPNLFPKKKKKMFLNLSRCESHRDLLFPFLLK